MKNDIYTTVTNKIIEQMETVGSDWIKTWSCSSAPVNIASGKNYQGMNVLMLGMSANLNGFKSNQWGTFKQWTDKGYKVAKGSKASDGIFYKTLEIKDDETDETKKIPMLRGFKLFNADQIEGYEPPAIEPRNNNQVIESCQSFVNNTGATVKHGGDRAFYTPAGDYIAMPELNDFDDSNAYYATLLHELSHWTGSSDRLGRLKLAPFGSPAYAFEELIAEIGSAFLCQFTGISNEPRKDHAQYLNGWLKALRNDKRLIFKAATQAQKAVELLHSLQPEQKEKAA